MKQKESKILTEGLNNWKLRLILSALLCIIGLGFMISMVIGLFINLTVYDKSLVGIAIFMVGVPAYLIVSNLAKVDQYTITEFLNQNLTQAEGKADVLVKKKAELDEDEISKREELEELFTKTPLYKFLPDKPIKQAFSLFIISVICSLSVWLLG